MTDDRDVVRFIHFIISTHVLNIVNHRQDPSDQKVKLSEGPFCLVMSNKKVSKRYCWTEPERLDQIYHSNQRTKQQNLTNMGLLTSDKFLIT